MADKLQGKSAVVTGGGRGIGRGIALALAREGANVVVNDIFRNADGASAAEPFQMTTGHRFLRKPGEWTVDELSKIIPRTLGISFAP